MDVTGVVSSRIMDSVRGSFVAGNDIILRVTNDKIFHLMRVAHYFKMHGHAVEWRHDAATYVWICHRRSRARVVITTASQVETVKTMVLRHRLYELELEATGEMPVNWAHAITCWACSQGFVSYHETVANSYRVMLWKPHDALMEMDLDE